MQFIDANWKLWNVPVGFEQIIGTHSNEAVGNLITEILKPYLGSFFLLPVSLFLPSFLTLTLKEQESNLLQL